jgi:hypothetical protein
MVRHRHEDEILYLADPELGQVGNESYLLVS